MNLKFLMLITLLASIQLVYAENHLLIIGGGGEPEGDTTIFDGDINDLGQNLKNLKWNTEISFNGGHKNTEKIIQEEINL